MFSKRSGGVLAHPTSFPSPYGIGDFGDGARAFIDFMHAAKMGLWQVLPLGPTSFGDSPYQSFSTFAGNPYLISPDELVKAGYLTAADVADVPAFDPRRADYGPMINYKTGLFRKAYARFSPDGDKQFAAFCKSHRDWLDNYALFVAIKSHFISERANTMDSPELTAYRKANAKYLTPDELNDYFYGAVWQSWPEPLARRDPAALKAIAKELADEIGFHTFLQYEFFRQWEAVKGYAHEKGLTIIGDLPIFVALDSSDVWADPGLYCLDGNMRQTVMAGVPPDYFAETGQLWRNPLYKWDAHKKTGYAWWVKRVAATLSVVDIVRIDHFRGFESYWAVPYGEATAVKGKWLKGPGKALFAALEKQLGPLPIIAEDLGIITEKVAKLRASLGLPGMKVLHFAFDPSWKSDYLPHNFKDSHTVVYTGTHDNDTTLGWYAAAPEQERDCLRRYLNVSGEDAAWDLIRLAFSSSAVFAVAPIQDIMSLGADDRMNRPGIATGYWKFRYTADMLTTAQAERLAGLAKMFNRVLA